MIALKKILVPTDFSEASQAALMYARAFAETFHASLHLLHVIESPVIYDWEVYDPRPEVIDGRGGRHCRPGRLPGHRAVDQRTGTVRAAGRQPARPGPAHSRCRAARRKCHRLLRVDRGRRRPAPEGTETARRAMDMVQQIGGRRLAAPPVGATKQTDLSLLRAAERYRALLEVGQKIGVVPQVEVWGFSTTLGRLGECALVAIESGHPQACILADVYHLHKGGSGFGGLRLLNAAAMYVFHMNDYPAQPPRAEITDAHRIYPGDGVAPLTQLLRDLRRLGFRGILSLELFNREYWKQDALTVARTGLDKMRTVARNSLNG